MRFSIISVLIGILLLSLSTRANSCTGILLHDKDGSIVHGRTLEFGIMIDTSVAFIPRGHKFVGQAPAGKGLTYNSKYAALGIIAFNNKEILDGINEKGLAVGTFYFPGFAGYTPVSSQNQAKALSAGGFPNWILSQFATTDEVRKAIENKSVVITPTALKGWGPTAPPFHYVVYDKTGKSIVIEPVGGKLVIHDNPIGVMANSPTFDWHMTNLRNYIQLNPKNVPPVKVDGTTIKPLGQGSGLLGLPGDFTPPSRFVRAAIFSITAIPAKNAQEGVLQAFHILNNFDIPVGASRDESDGLIHTDYTMLTVVRDPQSLSYYYKTYDDQTIRVVHMNDFNKNGKKIKVVSTKGKQSIVDMSGKLK